MLRGRRGVPAEQFGHAPMKAETPYAALRRKRQKTLLDWHSRVARSCIGTDIVDPSTGEILKQVHNLFIERPDPPPLKPRFSATLGSAETRPQSLHERSF